MSDEGSLDETAEMPSHRSGELAGSTDAPPDEQTGDSAGEPGGSTAVAAAGATLTAAAASGLAEPVPFDDGEEVEEPPRRVGTLVLSLVVLLLVLAGLLALLADSLGDDGVATASEALPDVVEMEVGEARDLLSELGFIPLTQFEENDDFPENTVFDQDPSSGTKLELGSEVVLLVSSGSSIVEVPEVVGLQATAARSLLETSGFLVSEAEEFHDVAAVGEVIRQDPASEQSIAIGSIITITVSQGPEPLEIPDLEGKSEIEAANTLGNMGMEVAFFEEESENIDEGKVVRTDPPAGEELPPGSVVTVIVSTGKFVEVPDVVGLRSDEAINVLRGAQINPTVELQPLGVGDPNDGKVVEQDPPPGEKVPRASIVTVRVGAAPQVETTTTTEPTDTTTSTIPPAVLVLTISSSSMPAGTTGQNLPRLTWATRGGDSVVVEGPGGTISKQANGENVKVCPGTVPAPGIGACGAGPGDYTYTVKVLAGGRVVAQKDVRLTVTS